MAEKKALYGYERIYKTKCLLKNMGIEFDKGTALEFGCYDGKDTYGLLSHGFSKLVLTIRFTHHITSDIRGGSIK